MGTIRSVHLPKKSDDILIKWIDGNPGKSISKYISGLIEDDYERKKGENNGSAEEAEAVGEQNDHETTEVE